MHANCGAAALSVNSAAYQTWRPMSKRRINDAQLLQPSSNTETASEDSSGMRDPEGRPVNSGDKAHVREKRCWIRLWQTRFPPVILFPPFLTVRRLQPTYLPALSDFERTPQNRPCEGDEMARVQPG